MTLEREIKVEGKVFKITISDDCTVLHSAYAEGRAVIGLWDRQKADGCLAPARYVVEKAEDADDEFLERVVRRMEGLPLHIAGTERILIRELVPEDCSFMPKEDDGGENNGLFSEREALKDYIRCQYGFYEYGIWALVDRNTKRLVGKAGLRNLELFGPDEFLEAIKNNDTPVELGYHIFSAFRQQGYGKEACRAILHYGAEAVADRIYARIREDNLPSVKLAESLGFRLIARADSGSDSRMCLYGWNCSGRQESAHPW
ncbi:GNAT family N-acetyltransferase [Lachnospiraceae bacterium 54-53]